jgi:hypothetical protein
MGWTDCFPAGIVCKDYTTAPGEASHGYHHTALASIGIDIGEEVFHIVRFGADRKIAFFRATTRGASKSRTPGSAILVGERQPQLRRQATRLRQSCWILGAGGIFSSPELPTIRSCTDFGRSDASAVRA